MTQSKPKLTIILFSDSLDKVLAAFNLAIGAASSGMDATIFFTFWGLNVIKRNEGGIKSKGVMRKMLNAMNRGGTKRLPLSKFHMLGMGKWMMGRLMKDIKFPDVQEMLVMAKDLGVRFVACTTTMGMMGLGKDAFVTEVDTFAGVATYLAEAGEGRINLFI
ncbi:MAG: DsrE/DsrF/DrsH-like family protein [Chloroflexota bacterium]